MFYMIKVNGVLLSDKIYWTLREAIDACYEQKKLGCAVTTDIVRIDNQDKQWEVQNLSGI